MKKILLLICFAFYSLSNIVNAFNYTDPETGFEFKEDYFGVYLSRVPDYYTDVIIPSEITVDSSQYTVNCIGNDAFK